MVLRGMMSLFGSNVFVSDRGHYMALSLPESPHLRLAASRPARLPCVLQSQDGVVRHRSQLPRPCSASAACLKNGIDVGAACRASFAELSCRARRAELSDACLAVDVVQANIDSMR